MWIKILISFFFCPRRRNLIDPVPGLAPLPSGIPSVSHSRRRRLRHNFGAHCHGELGAKAVHLAYQSRPFGCGEEQSRHDNNSIEKVLPQEDKPNNSCAFRQNPDHNHSTNEFAHQASDSLQQCRVTKRIKKRHRCEEIQEKHDMKKSRKLIRDDDRQEKNDIQMIVKTVKDDEKRAAELIKQGRMFKGDTKALIKSLEYDDMTLIVKQDTVSEFDKFFVDRAKKSMADNRQPGPVKRKCQKPASKQTKKMSQKDARETKDAEARSNAAAKKMKKPVAKANVKVCAHQPNLY